MNKRINRIVLWFCTGVLSLVFVGIIVSCDPDDGGSGTGGGKFSDITATYYDVGDDCGAIEVSKQHIPKDTAELKRLIERDITQQGNTVNLNYIDTSAITDMSSLFETEEGATFNGAIRCWDVSKVTTMSAMFKGAKAFNQDISSWDVGAVTTMESMFEGAEAFEQDLTDWGEHVQLTVNTASMFAGASKVTKVPNWKKTDGTKICFDPSAHATVMEDGAELKTKIDELIANGNINHTETCHVKDMNQLFANKTSFNGDLSQWDVSKVTTMDSMFDGAGAFDQNISNWDVSNVEDMGSMFNGAEVFSQDISNWNVSKVTTMSAMFKDAKAFNQDISSWDVGAVTTMESMFEGAEAFEQDLTDWGEHVQLTVNTASMFAGASKVTKVPNWKKTDGTKICFDPSAHATVMEDGAELKTKIDELIANGNINHTETCHVKDMNQLFANKTSFNGDLSQWDVSKVTTMANMFKGAKAFNRDISGWDVGAVTTMESMFEGAEAFEQDLTDWGEHVQSTVNTASMFANASQVDNIPNWKEAGVCFDHTAHVHVMKDGAELKTKIDDLITSGNINNIETCNVKDMNNLFASKTAFNGDLSQWDVSKVTTMSAMFKGAKAFNRDISGWDVGAVTTMESMFEGAEAFEADLTAWSEHVLQTVNTASMFADASKASLPNWKKADGTRVCFAPTAHVNVMENKDKLVEKLNELITVGTPSPDLNHLETCNITDMSSLFQDKTTFNGAISQWDLSKVTTTVAMFSGATAFNQPIGNWNVSNVKQMDLMFYNAKKFCQNLDSWTIGTPTKSRMFISTGTDSSPCDDIPPSWF